MAIRRLPLSFRKELLAEIHKHLEAGQCGLLIGVASCGKSRLVEFMGRQDVRRHYLGDNSCGTLFPWVDGNDLLELSEWGLYEKILNAIVLELKQAGDAENEDLEKLEAWYWKLTQPDLRPLARRIAVYALADLKRVNRIVLLLDDFEKFFARADESVFSGLRSLRDTFKRDNQYRVLYLVFSRKQLVLLRDSMTPEFESFVELFKNFAYPVGCYSKEDALFMIERLSDAFPFRDRMMTLELAERLYRATGGHAGLIDAAFHSKTEVHWGQADITRPLIQASGVWNECASIWDGLTEAQQSALLAIASGEAPENESVTWLENSGLLRRDTNGALETIDLMRLYLTDYIANLPDIHTDPGRRMVIDGQAVELTEREFTLANALLDARGNWLGESELYQALHSHLPSPGIGSAVAEIHEVMRHVITKLRRADQRTIIFSDPDRGYRML